MFDDTSNYQLIFNSVAVGWVLCWLLSMWMYWFVWIVSLVLVGSSAGMRAWFFFFPPKHEFQISMPSKNAGGFELLDDLEQGDQS